MRSSCSGQSRPPGSSASSSLRGSRPGRSCSRSTGCARPASSPPRTRRRAAARARRSRRSIDGDDIIGSDQWARLAIGGPITLDVARSFPAAFNRVSDNAPLLVLAIVLLAGAVFTRVALPRFVERLRYLVLRRRLQTAGVQVQGTVVEVVSANVRVSGRTLARVRYRYADEHGGEHAGQSESVAPDVAEAWQGRGKGSVLYDPERPDASVWLGDCND
ncbi:MAG: DUF3592 domain-containing protein [Chloroflexi bacterium]|nr:MAG: DUF3592 domain-containing protein [Chloroflexota bacterium]